MQMGNQRIGGMMMEQIGSSSKTVRNLQDMEKIIPEHIIFIMGNMRTGGTMMDKRGIFSKMENAVLCEIAVERQCIRI